MYFSVYLLVIYVGEGRSGNHGRTATNVVDTGIGHNDTVVETPRVTWADVVKKPAAASNEIRVPAILSKGTTGIGKRTKNMIVLKRSFFQNNPGNRIKV